MPTWQHPASPLGPADKQPDLHGVLVRKEILSCSPPTVGGRRGAIAVALTQDSAYVTGWNPRARDSQSKEAEEEPAALRETSPALPERGPSLPFLPTLTFLLQKQKAFSGLGLSDTPEKSLSS